MLTARRRYNNTEKEYFKDLYQTFGCIPENHKEAIKHRMGFFRTYVLKRV